MKDRRAVLLDLDDTLYVCRPGEEAGLRAVVAEVSAAVGRPAVEVEAAYRAARSAVKARIDGRGSSHSRLLYLTEMVHALGRADLLGSVRRWERAFWQAFLSAVRLRKHTQTFLEALRRAEKKVAIVTDLTLEVQLWKLEAFGLGPYVDAIAVSEEVPLDKPEGEIFTLAMARLGVSAADSVMVGDHDGKDGEGARRLGIPFVRVTPEDTDGDALLGLAREMGGS